MMLMIGAVAALSGCGSGASVTNHQETPTGIPDTRAPTVALSPTPTAVAQGQSATLTWSSTNATSCTASGGWSGTEPVSGTFSTGGLSSDTTYTLTCSGAGGSASQSATVTVGSSAPPPPPTGGLSCTGSSGALALKASMVRDTGISPLLVFFDATGTTDSSITGNTTTFQDVTHLELRRYRRLGDQHLDVRCPSREQQP